MDTVIRPHVEALGINYLALSDPKGLAAKYFKVDLSGFTFLLVDRAGKVRFRESDFGDTQERACVAAILDLLAEAGTKQGG